MKNLWFFLIIGLIGCSSFQRKEKQIDNSSLENQKLMNQAVSAYKTLVDQLLIESYGEKILDPNTDPVEFIYVYELMLDAQYCGHSQADIKEKECKTDIKCLEVSLNKDLYDRCEAGAIQNAYLKALSLEAQDQNETDRVYYFLGCMAYVEKEFLGYNKIRNYNTCSCVGLKMIDNENLNLKEIAQECYSR